MPFRMGVAKRLAEVEQKVEQSIRRSRFFFGRSCPFTDCAEVLIPRVRVLVAKLLTCYPPFARQLRIFKRGHRQRIAASLSVAIAGA
jgi:hypothetical protein